jgi:NSS family neurotransmitter:Na+ symporter
MIELATRLLIDAGLTRRKAIGMVMLGGLWFGAPSALSLPFLHNQDWVWGVGLMLSGLFFALAARRFGIEKLRTEVVNGEGADLRVGRWWSFLVGVVVPVEAVILMLWWLWEARGWDPEGWLHPFRAETVGTVLFQWLIALTLVFCLNRWMTRRRKVFDGEQAS